MTAKKNAKTPVRKVSEKKKALRRADERPLLVIINTPAVCSGMPLPNVSFKTVKRRKVIHAAGTAHGGELVEIVGVVLSANRTIPASPSDLDAQVFKGTITRIPGSEVDWNWQLDLPINEEGANNRLVVWGGFRKPGGTHPVLGNLLFQFQSTSISHDVTNPKKPVLGVIMKARVVEVAGQTGFFLEKCIGTSTGGAIKELRAQVFSSLQPDAADIQTFYKKLTKCKWDNNYTIYNVPGATLNSTNNYLYVAALFSDTYWYGLREGPVQFEAYK
jgi:hypothetical protein